MTMNDSNAWTEWMHREQGRILEGKYQPVPVMLDYPVKHFVHLSTTETEADYVAYTPSEAYGEADRQIRLKFGRYLKKTFSEMTDAEIQHHVTTLKSTLATMTKPAALYFTTDVETINRIFETRMQACGSCCTSCMHGKFDGDEIRPYHVYANSPDVAVAYVMTGNEIVSRSVVSTRSKTWVRAYSIAAGDNDTDCGTLKRLLEEAGYSKGDLYGSRLSKLDTRNVMLPYIDNSGAHVRDDDEYWVVVKDDDDGDYAADCTDGTATEIGGNRCSSCNEREDDCECCTCECCGERNRDGCDDCRMCEECDGCTEHDGCSCTRCGDCHKIINPRHRYTDHCECTRCSDCHELEDDCECEHCEKCHELTGNCECEDDENESDSGDTETASETEDDTLGELIEHFSDPVRDRREFLQSVWSRLLSERNSTTAGDRFEALTAAFEILRQIAAKIIVEDTAISQSNETHQTISSGVNA